MAYFISLTPSLTKQFFVPYNPRSYDELCISYKYFIQIFTTQVRNLVFKNVFSHICCFHSVLELRGNGMDTKATFEMRRHLLQICSLLGEP